MRSPDELLRRGAAKLAGDPRVIAVWGFGSRARGNARPESDVDLAALLDRPLSLRDELRLRAEVTAELGRDDVDLVLLLAAPPLLRHEVVSAGCRLFSRDDATADQFERRTAMARFDTAYLRRVQRELAREAAQQPKPEATGATARRSHLR